MRHHPPNTTASLSTDITLILKSCVKTLRTRNRACGVPEPPRAEPRRLSALGARSREVAAQVAKMALFLEDVMTAYANFSGHTPPYMTDAERDRIDMGIPRLAEEAKAMLSDLETAVGQKSLSPQHKEHQLAVVRLIREYLRQVTSRHGEMRAARLERAGETKRLARLHNTGAGSAVKATPTVVVPSYPEYEEQLQELSAEEMQMFEEENAALQMELSGVMSELHTLEGTLTGVAKLQQEFTEKVVEQEMDLDKVNATVVATTETLKDANQQLRQAIQRNAGLRVYILFSLLVMSFSLLFLDWYND